MLHGEAVAVGMVIEAALARSYAYIETVSLFSLFLLSLSLSFSLFSLLSLSSLFLFLFLLYRLCPTSVGALGSPGERMQGLQAPHRTARPPTLRRQRNCQADGGACKDAHTECELCATALLCVDTEARNAL